MSARDGVCRWCWERIPTIWDGTLRPHAGEGDYWGDFPKDCPGSLHAPATDEEVRATAGGES